MTYLLKVFSNALLVLCLMSSSTLLFADDYSDDAKRNSSHVRHMHAGSSDDGPEASGFLKKNSSNSSNSSVQGSGVSGNPISPGSPEKDGASSGTQSTGSPSGSSSR